MVYYRTYRPQTIHELDKEDVRLRLKPLLASKKPPQALLFAGPKGTGKTSTARIIAKVLNCENLGKDAEPCNNCDSCKSIVLGSFSDVYEIDAASNRGIDEIRELRERVNLAPSMGKTKVYIIDEVHMLTREAFNALLKTLEEPPPHVVFILATTEIHKLPDTIISRCIVLQFSKATPEEIQRSLTRVKTGEKLSISDKSLTKIARHSDGSFRDAVKLLEQAAAEKRLSDSGIDELLGVSAINQNEFIEIVSKKNTKQALKLVKKAADDGADMTVFIEILQDTVHEELLAHFNDSKQKPKLSVEDAQILAKLLQRAYTETKTSYISELPLELAILDFCSR